MATAADLADDIGSYTHDPKGYALYAFPWGEAGSQLEHERLREWQAQVLDDIGAHLRDPASRYTPCLIAVASGHGIGKSALVGIIVKWAMDTFPDCRCVVTANTEDQLRGKTWPEIGKWQRLAITADWFDLGASTIASKDPKHADTWTARLTTWSKNNTEAFAGLHNAKKRIVVIMDEGSAIDDKVWDVAEGALTDEHTEIIWIVFGNPTRATGKFRECFRRNRHRWKTYQIDSRTVEGTNKELFAKWIEDYGIDCDFVKVRCRGMFPALSAMQFISEEDVDRAYGKHLRPEQYNWAPKILALDNAWEGDDDGCIGLRQGLAFKVLRTFAKNDNDIEVANMLARFEDENQADAVFIDAGYGTGVVSAGRTMGRNWQLVWFGGKSGDPGCYNKRSEMWQGIKNWLKEGGAIPENPTLREDLLGPEVLPRLDGKIALEPKKAMKLRGLKSPNIADTLGLTFAAPVYIRQPDSVAGSQPSSGDFDPFVV